MSDTAKRWRRLSAEFTRRAEAVQDGAWNRPAPCEGWVARDVVRHLVEWMPNLFLESAGLPVPKGPAVGPSTMPSRRRWRTRRPQSA